MPIIRHGKRTQPKIPKAAKARAAKAARRISVSFNEHQHQPYFKKPRFIKKSSVSLGRLVLRSNPHDMREALGVSLAKITRGKPIKLRNRTLNQLRGQTTTDENGHRHTITVMYEGDKIKRDTPVTVDCTCPRHAFFYEYANAQRGLSPLYRCNGDPPHQTNPGMRYSGCKHVIRVAAYILRHPKKFN